MLFIDYIYKTNKYNMPLYIFSKVIEYKKSFYNIFFFLWYENMDLYSWVMTKVKEL